MPHPPSSSLIIGLTGGIGSGKTAASDHFAHLGINIVDADLASRAVVKPGSEGLIAIEAHFGSNILTSAGELDRAQLRQIIFQDSAAKQWLEALLHPLIRDYIQQQLQNATSPYVILVSPLLFESGQSEFCDRAAVVDVAEQIQIERASARDNNDRAQIKRIIASQISREDRLAKADDVIDNSHDLFALQQQVESLHQQYLQLAQDQGNE